MQYYSDTTNIFSRHRVKLCKIYFHTHSLSNASRWYNRSSDAEICNVCLRDLSLALLV